MKKTHFAKIKTDKNCRDKKEKSTKLQRRKCI